MEHSTIIICRKESEEDLDDLPEALQEAKQWRETGITADTLNALSSLHQSTTRWNDNQLQLVRITAITCKIREVYKTQFT